MRSSTLKKTIGLFSLILAGAAVWGANNWPNLYTDQFHVTGATATTVPYFDANKKLVSSSTTPTQLSLLATATSSNTPSTLVERDGSGNFTAGNITASLTGNVTGNVVGNLTGNVTGNADTATTAAAWTTARLLAGNSVNGSVNVPFANKFIVQGTTDTGLSAAQFLGALGTGIVKNTTSTGILSIAVAGDFPTLNQNTSGTAASLSAILSLALGGTNADLSATGGTSQVLKQSAGHIISVAQLACADLSNSVASCSTDATNASNIGSGTLAVARGGSGAGTFTAHGVLLGNTTSAFNVTAAGSAGQVLQSGGASADPTYSTPTYPSTSGTAGKFLRSDGTNNVYTTMTHPDTAVAGSILNASSANVLAATVTPTLGVAGASTGTIGLSGVTSGVVTIQPQSAAGTYNFNLPITAGNAGNVLTSQGGGSTAMTWSSPAVNALTTTGDIPYSSDNSGTNARLPIGPTSSVMTVVSGLPAWVPSSPQTQIYNCSVTATVAASAMTVALKDAAGNDPSASSPCSISFRNATAATGTYSIVSATAALSVVVSNGSALGCTASSTCVVWVYAINNAGTIELGVIGQGLLDDGVVASSAAEGGAGAADSSNTLYSTTARSSKAVRLIGRLNVTPGASFAWSAAPTTISSLPEHADYVAHTWNTNSLRVGSILVASGCTSATLNPTGMFLSGVSNSAGNCTTTFPTSYFSSQPVCTCTMYASSFTDGHCRVISTATGTVNTLTEQASNGAAAASAFSVTCFGPQ